MALTEGFSLYIFTIQMNWRSHASSFMLSVWSGNESRGVLPMFPFHHFCLHRTISQGHYQNWDHETESVI